MIVNVIQRLLRLEKNSCNDNWHSTPRKFKSCRRLFKTKIVPLGQQESFRSDFSYLEKRREKIISVKSINQGNFN